MPTIIDSLVIRLGLDSSDFNSGRGRVDAGLRQTEVAANRTAKAIGQFLAVIGGSFAIKRFVENSIDAAAGLGRLSQSLNTSVSDISAWSQASELAGGSADGLQSTMSMLSRAQTELMLTGTTGLIPYLSALGIGLSGAGGKAKPINDLMLELSDKFSAMDSMTAINFAQMMGIDAGTMQLLMQGRAEVERVIAQQKQFGAITRQQAEDAKKLKTATISLGQTFDALGRDLLSKATPALLKIAAATEKFINWIRDNKGDVVDFIQIVGAGFAGLALAVMPINLAAIAVGGLAAAIVGLYQDYQTWKRGGESLIDWAKWEPAFKAVESGIKWLKDSFSSLFSSIFDGFQQLNLSEGQLRGVFAAIGISVAAVAAPILGVSGAIAGVSAAIVTLIGDYQNWKNTSKTGLIDWEKWEPAVSGLERSIRAIKNLIEDLIYRAIAAGDIISALYNDDKEQFDNAVDAFLHGTGKRYGGEDKEAPPTYGPADAAVAAGKLFYSMNEAEIKYRANLVGAGAKALAAGDTEKAKALGAQLIKFDLKKSVDNSAAEKKAEAMNFFQSQGWSAEQSAGIVASIQRESNFNQSAIGDNGQAFGIAQWHPDRQQDFKALFGKDIRESSYRDQLAFIQHELTQGKEQAAGRALKAEATAEGAAEVVSSKYERPKNEADEILARGAIATQIMRGIPDASKFAAGAGAAAGASANVTNNNQSSKSISTTIGEININSSAQNMQGIQQDARKSMEYLFSTQANGGLY